MNLDENLDRVLRRYDELSARVASHDKPGSADYTRMLREYAELTTTVESINGLREVQRELRDLAELIVAADSDAEMRKLAARERDELTARLPDLDAALRRLFRLDDGGRDDGGEDNR